MLFGQERRIELADKYFDQYAYNNAIELYKEAKELDKNNWTIYAKLGDCYYYLSDIENAWVNYDEYYKNTRTQKKTEIEKALLLRYLVCLQSLNKPISKELLKELGVEKLKTDKNNDTDQRYGIPENLRSINSDSSDFGTFIFKNSLYFSSSRKNPEKEKQMNKRLYKWNEEPFLDIYEAVIDQNNHSISIVSKPKDSLTLSNINTIAHEASVTLTKTGDTMYFSGGEVKNGKLVYNKRGTSNLRLKRAIWDSNLKRWVVNQRDTTMNYFDFINYSVGNPALSPDNKRLYFVTCAPFSKAQGQTDIYYVNILSGGRSFGKVTSIIGINSAGRESFPFIASDGTLYFSSDGIQNDSLGLGLLDVYKVENLDNIIQKHENDLALAKQSNNPSEVKKLMDKMDAYYEKEMKVIHLKRPINSEMDDFAFYIEEPKKDQDEVFAYFSSNREGGMGDDDIYRSKVKIDRFKTIQVDVIDDSNQELLGKASVDLLDSEGKLLETFKDSTGSYKLEVKVGATYKVRGYADRYVQDQLNFNSADIKDKIVLKLKPYPCLVSIEYEGFESINQIEFEFDVDSINSEAKNTLSEVIDLLISNRDMKIKIESHTDTRGTNQTNIELSKRRALNTKAYLIKEGVYESQIDSAIGYGEERPCFTDEEIKNLPEDQRESAHRKNRRSHFIIVGCEDNTPICPEIDE